MVRLVWGVSGLGIILFAAAVFDGPARYLAWRPAAIVVAGMVCFTFTRHSLYAVFRGTLHGEADEASIAAMRTMRSTTHASGAIGFLIGLIGALTPLEGGQSLSAGVGDALLAPLYALVIAELLIAPLLHRRMAQMATRVE